MFANGVVRKSSRTHTNTRAATAQSLERISKSTHLPDVLTARAHNYTDVVKLLIFEIAQIDDRYQDEEMMLFRAASFDNTLTCDISTS